MKVSLVTPYTQDREHFLDRIKAIAAYQTYPIHEHLFDSSDTILGDKRNNLIDAATGDIIVHFDVDDIYTPTYVETAVIRLIDSNADIIGMNGCYFHNVAPDTFHHWQSSPKKQVFITEATWVFYKNRFKGFKSVNIGEGREYLPTSRYAYYQDDTFLATIHGGNISSHLALYAMKKVPANEALLLKKHFYG